MDGDNLGVLAANKDLTLVFIAQISHYEKFTALHKLISIVLLLTKQVSISREIIWWQGYFFKNCSGDKGDIIASYYSVILLSLVTIISYATIEVSR